MADPEAIYSEVLTEEQQKGTTPAAAEARAKAARARAEHGSPHPKEPKWWPGAQPHLEGGGDGAAPAQDEVEEETAVEEVPVAEAAPAPAEPAPAAQPPDLGQEEAREVPATPAPAEAPAAAAAAPQPAAVQPAAAVATAPEPALPSGVTHGTPTGNRLRPEDSVGTDAQFEGQQAMYQRRKLIDDLVATGVPRVTAANAGRARSQPFAFLVYLVIILLAGGLLWSQRDSLGAAEPGPKETTAPDGGGGGTAITAQNVAFDTDTLSLPADKAASIEFTNDDASSIQHNIGIYTEEGGDELFKGDPIPGGNSTTYQVDPLKAGTYYFQCDIHPGMNGSVEVK